MANYQGIDVSVHNGYVDYSKVKSSKSFVMIRAGYGKYISQKDARFEENYKNAKANGLHVGAYWYSYAHTVADAVQEAKIFLQVIAGKQFDMPVAFDMEESFQASMSSSLKAQIIEAFCNYCEKQGYFVQLYSYESFLNGVPAATRAKYDVWCANITRKPSITYGMHQYSFTGRVSGISGNVDLNETSKDYPSIIKGAGLNGYPKSSTPTKNPSVLDKTGFKKGDSNEGTLALKKLLKIAKAKGVITQSVDDNLGFGDGTEKAVNQFLKKLGYKENSIAGKNFINKLYDAIK
jgi:GH25 family lysozyme M1 (1,4-beta-N-acetylmuramidase)